MVWVSDNEADALGERRTCYTYSVELPLTSHPPMYLFKRRWILTSILVLLASGVMVRLGVWQLDRLEQKRTYIAQSLAQINASPMVLTGQETGLDALAQRYRRVVISGTFDYDHEILLKSQLYQGEPGYHLLTPLRIDGSDRAVMVDRGWVPSLEFNPGELDPYHEQERISIEGRIEPEDRRPRDANLPTEPEQEWYRVDIGALQNQMPYELLPFYVAATSENITSAFPVRNPPEIILDEGPHLGYAIQWFLFAIAVPIVYVYQIRKLERQGEEHEDVQPELES